MMCTKVCRDSGVCTGLGPVSGLAWPVSSVTIAKSLETEESSSTPSWSDGLEKENAPGILKPKCGIKIL